MATTITAQKRESKAPHSALTQLRSKGFVPGIVYGFNMETTPISIVEVDLIKTLRETGRNGVISLDLDGKSTNVILNDYQMDALKGSFEHVDFLAINMTEELDVQVTVHTVGEAAGASEGGIVNQPNREVTVRVKPSDIPDYVEVDITDLAIGDSILVGDIRDKVPYQIMDDDDFTLVSVSAPLSEEEVEESVEAPTGEEAEPELVGGDDPDNGETQG